jgi:hypothetical protein
MTRRELRRGNWSVQELERLRDLLPKRGVADTALLLRRSPESVRRKAGELFAGPPRADDQWTGDDEFLLRRSWGAVEPRLLALMLRRSLSSILRRAAEMRQSLRQGAWTRSEERMLKQFYGTRSDEDLEVCLRRPRADIGEKAASLCLSKDKRFLKERRRGPQEGSSRMSMPRWLPEEIELLRQLYFERDNLEIARQLDRSVASVANKANQLGLKKSSELLARIGRSNVAVRYAPRRRPDDAS